MTKEERELLILIAEMVSYLYFPERFMVNVPEYEERIRLFDGSDYLGKVINEHNDRLNGLINAIRRAGENESPPE